MLNNEFRNLITEYGISTTRPDFKDNRDVGNNIVDYIFVNKFLNQYTFLNEYNKVLLDTLINNKDILSKNSFIVLPDSWDQLLKDMNIIFDESTYKANQLKQSGGNWL